MAPATRVEVTFGVAKPGGPWSTVWKFVVRPAKHDVMLMARPESPYVKVTGHSVGDPNERWRWAETAEYAASLGRNREVMESWPPPQRFLPNWARPFDVRIPSNSASGPRPTSKAPVMWFNVSGPGRARHFSVLVGYPPVRIPTAGFLARPEGEDDAPAETLSVTNLGNGAVVALVSYEAPMPEGVLEILPREFAALPEAAEYDSPRGTLFGFDPTGARFYVDAGDPRTTE